MHINHRRLGACLAGVWAGVVIGIATIAAPAGFATLLSSQAGRVAGRMFLVEAYAGLVIALLLLLLVRQYASIKAEAGKGSILSTEVVLVMGTVFCTVLGYFAVQSMLPDARAGQGLWSFGALHAVSVLMFGLKGLLALALAWRLSAA